MRYALRRRMATRQGDGETQIAQGYDLVQPAGSGDIALRSPQRNQEKYDACTAHRNRRARDLKKSGENGCVHVDAKRKLACSLCALSGPESRFWRKQRSEVYARPKGTFRNYGAATRQRKETEHLA